MERSTKISFSDTFKYCINEVDQGELAYACMQALVPSFFSHNFKLLTIEGGVVNFSYNMN